MKIRIVNRVSGQLVAEVPMVLVGMNYQPSMDEAADLAWKTACDDKLVSPDRRDDFHFQAVDEDGS